MAIAEGTKVQIIRGQHKGIVGTVVVLKADGRALVGTPNWSGVWLSLKSMQAI